MSVNKVKLLTGLDTCQSINVVTRGADSPPGAIWKILNVFLSFSRDQENLYTEKMQNLQQTLTEERDKVLHSANQQRYLLEESLQNIKTEEQRLRTKLVEAEEVCGNFFVSVSKSKLLVNQAD